MTYVFTIEDRKRSPNFGKEVMRAASILETPPILVCGIRTYGKTPYGLQNLPEAWMKEPPAILNRLMVLPENFDTEAMLKKIEENLEYTICRQSNHSYTALTNKPLKEKTRSMRSPNRRRHNQTTIRIRKTATWKNSCTRRSFQRWTIH